MSNNNLLSYSLNKQLKQDIFYGLLDSKVSSIKEMMYLAMEEQKKGRKIISLSVGIPYYPMPKAIKRRLIEIFQEKPDIDKYTFFTGMNNLREKIVVKIKKDLDLDSNPEEILITPGSMGALMYSLRALINPQDEVILLAPFFSSYKEQILLCGGKPVEVDLIEPKNPFESYRIDFELLNKKITRKTKAIIFNNPNNPTGNVFLKEDIYQLAEILIDKKIYLINDEVYDFLVYDNKEYFNITSIKELWPRVIRCWSFSKKYGMTGWRLGYLHANKDLVRMIMKIHDATIVCTNHLAQEAGLIALELEEKNDQELIKELEKNRKSLEENRNIVVNYLKEMKDFLSFNIPFGAYYIFPKILKDSISDLELAKKILYDQGVAVVPGSGFGNLGKNHLRISFGGERNQLVEGLKKIKDFFKK